jgi:multiple sugar transport system permease protein
MYFAKRNRLLGLAYLAPALIFVGLFTAYPFLQMVWLSFNNWSLIEPPKFVGLDNYTRAVGDRQFWTSLAYTLKYTVLITPILMVGGYAVALLTARNTPINRLTRTLVFMPVVIGLGASSLLWYWLYSARFGLVNRFLQDLGVITQPIIWLGTDTDLSTWAIIVSVVWKVLGFGIILFVAAIQGVPAE